MVRHRGLFPIPVPVVNAANKPADASRSVLRRWQAHQHVEEWHRDLVQTLNAMFMGDERQGNFDGGGRHTLSQRICLARMKQAILDAGKPPDGINGREALLELQAKPGYAGDPAHLAPMDLDLISLPPSSTTAASLNMIFGEEARNFKHRLMSKVSAEVDVARRKAETELRAPYVDPLLRSSPRKYADFCRLLHDRGLVQFRLGCKERVGVFTVWKKSGKQRLVIDARLANLHFEPPNSVALATGSSFGMLEVPGGGPPLEVGGVDIADAFYHIALEKELQEFFGLAPIKAKYVGVKEVDGVAVKPGQLVFPCLAVVPMGWTLALWICQSAHEHVVDSHPAVDASLRCVDRRPLPEVLDYVHTQYVDNFVAISQKKGRAKALAEAVGVALNDHGLPTHEVEAGVGIETLGWAFGEDHPTVGVTRKRLWRLRLATLELIMQGHASGKTIERLVGHFTFAGLLQRGLLSVFQATYCFIRKCYDKDVVLWDEVKRELRWAASLLCLVKRDLAAPWSSRVHATDASMWGRGVVAAERQVEEIKKLGRRNDRWRFKPGEENIVTKGELANEGDCIDAETLELVAPCLLEKVGVGDYMEVPLDFIGEDWKQIDGSKWDRVESIPILEGRAVVWLLQHLARSQKNLGKKHLVLSDSMSVTLALTKGRSSSSPMNRICRQVAALSFASGMHLHLRWIPSELNPADLPSRAQSLEGFNLCRGLRELQDNYDTKEHKGEVGWRRAAIEFHRGATKCQRIEAKPRADEQEETPHPPLGAGECHPGRESSCSERGASLRKGEAVRGKPRSHFDDTEVLLGNQDSGCGAAQVLCEGMAGLKGVGQGKRAQHRVKAGLGPCRCEQDELHVLRRARRGRCNDVAGGGEIPPSGYSQDGGIGEVNGSIDWLSQVGPAEGEIAYAVPHAGGRCEAPLGHQAPGVNVVASGVGNMLPSWRSTQAPEEGHCAANRSMSSLDHHPELRFGSHTKGPFRECSGRQAGLQADVQGGSVRRSNHRRPALHEELGKDHVGGSKGKGQRVPDVRLRHVGGGEVVERKPDGTRLHRARHQLHLPDQARKCLHRCVDRPPDVDGDPKKGTLGSGQKREKVHQWGPNFPGLRQPEWQPKTRSSSGRGLDQQDFRTWPLGRKILDALGLEIFSGSGHFSRAVRRRLKRVFCVEVDNCHGPQFDLTVSKIQKEILYLIATKQVAFVWLGTPCNSWSRARRWDGRGPGPLRDDHLFLMGLTGLSEKDQRKVDIGNSLMKFSAKIFRCCIQHNVPVALENPHTSRLWLAPPIKHLLNHKYTNWGYTDFCMDGKPFRKRTRLMWAHVDLFPALRHCSSRRGICARTGICHQQLQGTQGGQFLTMLAQPYPHRLCQRLATCFHAAVMQRASEGVWKILQGF